MKRISTMASTSLLVVLIAACSSSEEAPADASAPEHTGQSCKVPTDCYPEVDAGALHGDAQCLTRVPGGYCTHLCQTDADCCAVPGECKSGLKQVCAPFESTGMMMCFLSCEKEDLKPAPDGGVLDDSGFCATNASPAFGCRSTGGGSQNRKVCVP